MGHGVQSVQVQVLHIAWSRKPIHRNYTMHGQVLESVDHARYLGVDISSDLNFSHHINRITANVSKRLGFLKYNIKTKRSGIREAAYKTVVRPQFEYASPIWNPYTKKDIYKVEMVQRRAIRWSLNSYSSYQRVTELQQQLGLRTLEQRRVDAKVIMIYRVIHGLIAILLPPYFEQPLRMTRHNHPFALRKIHTAANYHKFSFFPSAVIYWSRLPAEVVLLPTLDQISVAVRLQDHHTL